MVINVYWMCGTLHELISMPHRPSPGTKVGGHDGVAHISRISKVCWLQDSLGTWDQTQ